MPAFHTPFAVQKRVADAQLGPHQSNKRPKQNEESLHAAADASGIADDPNKAGEQYWNVQWRKQQYKKHKTWEGDGVLVLSGGKGTLYNMDHTTIAFGKPNPDGACVDMLVFLGGMEINIESPLKKSDFLSGKAFGQGVIASEQSVNVIQGASSSLKKKFVPLKPITFNVNNSTRQQVSNSSSKAPIPLEPISLLGSDTSNDKPPSRATSDPCWSAHWRKRQNRKHKTWDGDAFIVSADGKLKLISEDGRFMGTAKCNDVPLLPGRLLFIAGREVEIEARVSATTVPRIIGSLPAEVSYEDEELDYSLRGGDRQVIEVNVGKKSRVLSVRPKDTPVGESSSSMHTNSSKFVPPTNFYNKPQQPKTPKPLHDPEAEGAIVMKEPNAEHRRKYNKKERPVVPVIIDPVLGRHLRSHQIEGVKFMYECVLGLRRHEGQGCILADEMGMGKTLQTISLIWTLLKQTPYFGDGPITQKVLIVCPASLIKNWKKEIHKWLGKDRVGVITGDKDKGTIKFFLNSKRDNILVIGYEKLRTVIDELNYCIPPIGLIICDEGHRLKSSGSKTTKMFEALNTRRRVILSGTPIQNDLSEFHAMADFCNPGLLDEYATFRKVFENPILKSRAPGCSAKELEIGEARQAQLQAIAKSFVLRREATILSKFLPPKSEYVVFVSASPLQKSMFAKILHPDNLSSLIHGSMARSLALIQLLTKLSNSPVLYRTSLEKSIAKSDDAILDSKKSLVEAMDLVPANALAEHVVLSGKLFAVSKLLQYLHTETDEKCILVSHYTSTLDVLESFCRSKRYTFLRLDGQTPVSKRQEYVDSFNKAPQKGCFIFLLSSKAGGVGLNLIGASRLCLIDSDWNPSHDLQSMARIHRDGQKRPVFIYRFLTAGTIDEKIYQRQVTKLGLSDSLMGSNAKDGVEKSKSDSFTDKELRDLFTFHRHTICHTHELLDCSCAITGNPSNESRDSSEINSDHATSDDELSEERPTFELGFQKASLARPEEFSKLEKAFAKRKKAELASLGEWTHISCLDASKRADLLDVALRTIAQNALQKREEMSKSFSHEENASEAEASHKLPDDIPGGAVCFVFEKSSKSAI